MDSGKAIYQKLRGYEVFWFALSRWLVTYIWLPWTYLYAIMNLILNFLYYANKKNFSALPQINNPPVPTIFFQKLKVPSYLFQATIALIHCFLGVSRTPNDLRVTKIYHTCSLLIYLVFYQVHYELISDKRFSITIFKGATSKFAK